MSNVWLVDNSNQRFEYACMRKQHPKNFIKELREARGWTLDEVAAKVGVTNPYISMLEQGKRGLSWAMVRKLADAFECHPLEVTDGPINAVMAKTAQEKKILETYRGLEEDARKLFDHMTDGLQNKSDSIKELKKPNGRKK